MKPGYRYLIVTSFLRLANRPGAKEQHNLNYKISRCGNIVHLWEIVARPNGFHEGHNTLDRLWEASQVSLQKEGLLVY